MGLANSFQFGEFVPRGILPTREGWVPWSFSRPCLVPFGKGMKMFTFRGREPTAKRDRTSSILKRRNCFHCLETDTNAVWVPRAKEPSYCSSLWCESPRKLRKRKGEERDKAKGNISKSRGGNQSPGWVRIQGSYTASLCGWGIACLDSTLAPRTR